MGILRKVGVVVLVIAIIVAGIGVAFFTGILGTPSAGLKDHGDWGNVSQERTEVITTVWVNNPNPIGLKIGSSTSVSYQLNLNGIAMANGEKAGISIPSGNSTISISTYIQNSNIPPWWVAFIQNNETLEIRAESSAHIEAGPLTTTVDLPTQRKTALQDSTPVINALSQAAAAAEGNYTKPMPTGDKVGYQIRRGWAEWGRVTNETTTVLFHFRVHNPSRRVPVPAVPDGLGMSVDMNNITMFRAQGDEFSPKNLDGDSSIQPGETQEVVLEVQMDNSKIDDWFRSHVRKEEQTQIRTRLQLVFSYQDTTFRIPEERGPAYTCQLQTAILIDNQNTATNCGQPSSVPGVATDNASNEDSNQTGILENTPTPITDRPTTTTPDRTVTTPDRTVTTPTPTPTPTLESNPPVARASASPTGGAAPLEVSFSASESSDPDGDIARYVWRFKDGSPPAEGKTVTHTFRTAGEYNVELVVIDSQGNRDTTTVTVTVDSRVG